MTASSLDGAREAAAQEILAFTGSLGEHVDCPVIIAAEFTVPTTSASWSGFCNNEGMRKAFLAKEDFDFSHREIN